MYSIKPEMSQLEEIKLATNLADNKPYAKDVVISIPPKNPSKVS
jgi:hypothetical protein